MAASRTRTKRTPEKVDKLRSLHDIGMSYKDMANELDITVSTVFRWLNPDADQKYLADNRRRYAINPVFRENCKRIHREDWARRQVNSFVYVILFPSSAVIKVGKSTESREYESRARTALKSKGFTATSEGTTIWTYPGNVRIEAFVQVMLAFRFKSLFDKERRLSEWFKINEESIDDLICVLEDIVSKIPYDHTELQDVVTEVQSSLINSTEPTLMTD